MMLYDEFIRKFENEVSERYSDSRIDYKGMEQYISYHLYEMIVNPLYMKGNLSQEGFIAEEFDFLMKLARSQSSDGCVRLSPNIKDLVLT